uniref:Uncharacterized protein n=1 Tax=Arundo donax TaxID=35708 RepID=A0A0A9D1P7_ARUDO
MLSSAVLFFSGDAPGEEVSHVSGEMSFNISDCVMMWDLDRVFLSLDPGRKSDRLLGLVFAFTRACNESSTIFSEGPRLTLPWPTPSVIKSSRSLTLWVLVGCLRLLMRNSKIIILAGSAGNKSELGAPSLQEHGDLWTDWQLLLFFSSDGNGFLQFI